MKTQFVRTLFLLLGILMTPTVTAETIDPFKFLENVDSAEAMAWVRQQNAVSVKLLESTPRFSHDREAVLKVLDNRERIPAVTRRGAWFYHLLQDDKFKIGLWRRTTLEQFRKPKIDEIQWESILDLDALAKTEGENWVWGGATCLAPDYNRCLLALSRGGADAKVVREFDLETRRFVDGGFNLPEAKSSYGWIDANLIFVATEFGQTAEEKKSSLTASGYPRIIKVWQRGTPLTQARPIYEANTTDVSAFAYVDHQPNYKRLFVGRYLDFYRSETYLIESALRFDELAKTDVARKRVNIPLDAGFASRGDWAFVELRSDMTLGSEKWVAGTLLVSDYQLLLVGQPKYQVLFAPTATRALGDNGGPHLLRDGILLSIQENVSGRLEEWRFDAGQGRWVGRSVNAPSPGDLSPAALQDPFVPKDELANSYFLTYTDFLTPTSLLLGQLGRDQFEVIKRNPQFFDSTGMRSEQRFATSKDGTRIPYFVVYPKNYQLGQNRPTLMYGYGGFQVSLNPWYSGSWGKTWYERGGIAVIANIRGGGEFGPKWHQSAIREKKQKSYDDFAAVAEDLHRSGIAKPSQIGIMGGSNGGLLVGAVMAQRPDLFGAVVCQVPLLDMKVYHRLLAGNSWMAEYGDPDKPEDWSFISLYSPYQNVKAGVKYPRILFTTSTRDDRVHPGHARKMAALMLSQGRSANEVVYFENIEGGHGGAANNEQRARMVAREMNFLWDTLGGSVTWAK